MTDHDPASATNQNHDQHQDQDQLLTPPEAAAELGLSVEQLAQMRREGTGPDWGELTRRLIRYTRGDLTTWQQHQSSTTHPDTSEEHQ